MLPSRLSRGLIAYVSIEDYSSVSKGLFGQIRRVSLLDEPLLGGGDTLKEVSFVEKTHVGVRFWLKAFFFLFHEQMEEPKTIVMSPCGEFFGVFQSCKIRIWSTSLEKMANETTLHHTQLVTVFAFHPCKRMLAAGDATGRVLIWKDIGDVKLTSVKSEDDAESFNWHSDEVTVLTFSSDGTFLYSGETLSLW